MKKLHAAVAIRQLSRNTGAVRTAYEHIDALKELGFDVSVLAERASESALHARGARWVRIWRWPLRGYMRRRWFDHSVQRWRRRHSPDIFISHGDAASDDVLVMHNCIELAHERVNGSPLPTGHEVGRLHASILNADVFRLLIANSELMKRDFVTRYQLPSERIKVIYPTVDRDMFNGESHQEKRAKGRSSVGVDPAVPLVGLVTSGDLRKRNVEFFLKVVSRLKGRISEDTRFLVVGRGSNEYVRMAVEFGIAEHMVFLQKVDEVDKVYHALDVFVLPAHIEEFGRVVLEALSCGTPSLVSANVGAAELMTDAGVDGVMPDYDLERWADAVQYLLGSERARHERREAAVALARRYDRERQKHVLMDIFSSLCRYRPKQ